MPEVMRHAFVVLAVLVPSMAFAQDIRMEERPRPEAPQGQVSLPPRHDSSAPPPSGVPPRDVRVEHDPAFVPPFVESYETAAARGQFGLSGWTAPNAPVAPAAREINGWFSFGFTLTWDGKPATTVR